MPAQPWLCSCDSAMCGEGRTENTDSFVRYSLQVPIVQWHSSRLPIFFPMRALRSVESFGGLAELVARNCSGERSNAEGSLRRVRASLSPS
jgi:hypothetical protein